MQHLSVSIYLFISGYNSGMSQGIQEVIRISIETWIRLQIVADFEPFFEPLSNLAPNRPLCKI